MCFYQICTCGSWLSQVAWGLWVDRRKFWTGLRSGYGLGHSKHQHYFEGIPLALALCLQALSWWISQVTGIQQIPSRFPPWFPCLFYSLNRSGACWKEAWSSQHDATAPTTLHSWSGVFLMMFGLHQTCHLVCWPKSLILVSSDHRTFIQLASESPTCILANAAKMSYDIFISGFLFATLSLTH